MFNLAANLISTRKLNEQKGQYELGGIQSTFAIKGQELDISQIMKILPHRYPFLLVDRIISIEEGKRAVGVEFSRGGVAERADAAVEVVVTILGPLFQVDPP